MALIPDIFSSVAQLYMTLWDPMGCSIPGFPVLHQLPEVTETHVCWVGDAIHLILCCPLLLPPSIISSIRVSSNKSVFCIRWPKYWSFSISPSNEYSELSRHQVYSNDPASFIQTSVFFSHHYSITFAKLKCWHNHLFGNPIQFHWSTF